MFHRLFTRRRSLSATAICKRLRLLIAEVVREADRLLLVVGLEVADPLARAVDDRRARHLPEAVRLGVVPVGRAVDLLLRHGHLLDLLDRLHGLGLRRGLGLGRRHGHRSRRHRSRGHRRGHSRSRRHRGLHGLGLGRGLGDHDHGLGHGLGHGLLRDGRRLGLGEVRSLRDLGVLRLPRLREGLVALGVLGTDALDDHELVGLLREALEGRGHRILAVLDIRLPRTRAESRLTLRLVGLLDLLGLLGLLLLGRHAALLADGGHDGVDECELVREREVGDLRDHLGHGHF